MIWKIAVSSKVSTGNQRLVQDIKDLGIEKEFNVVTRKIYFIDLDCSLTEIEDIAKVLFIDPVIEDFCVTEGVFSAPPPYNIITITYKKGVEDPVALSSIKALKDLGWEPRDVRTATEYEFQGLTKEDIEYLAPRLLYNPLIEEIMEYQTYKNLNTLDEFSSLSYEFNLKTVDILNCGDEELQRISQKMCLSLEPEEMKIIQEYFRKKGRNPTDCELETIAVLWSEHCAHKTFRGIIEYEEKDEEGNVIRREKIDNLLKSTIMKATKDINHSDCISVFSDNSGIVRFNERCNVCLKVETHNHPSSLEPYGGASTGIGGVIRDILGTGKGAKPVASLDVFCFSPWNISYKELPKGILHPKRIIKGVVKGVRDYGNRMGIPTIAGAVLFEERFLGNPLVYCGTLGILDKERSFKEIREGDLIVLCGAKTGKDGIHGATFSSQELDEHTIELTSAVQIGNPIEEKKLCEAILEAARMNLFNAITDCGAGGLSSAVTELAKDKGACVYLDRVPLKYKGLSYTEIWISESQERMVLFVPPQNIEKIKEIFSCEEVEFTVIGKVCNDRRLTLYYKDNKVCELDMEFLFEIPRIEKKAIWISRKEKDVTLTEENNYNEQIKTLLSSINIAPKDWIVTEYDHEVQGASVLKPISATEKFAINDASIIRPDLESDKCIAIGVGINPFYSDIDPYWMGASSLDEAIRNVIAVGGNLKKIFLLDNFSWGSPSDPYNLGALVKASKALYDFATLFGTPFISGKDSLNNEYIVEGKRIVIPHTLLITALCVIDDWKKIVPNSFLTSGNLIYIVGLTKDELGGSEFYRSRNIKGGKVPKVEKIAKEVFSKINNAIEKGLVKSCHDCSEGGVAVALSEMCMGSLLGATVFLSEIPHSGNMLNYQILFSESPSRFLVEVAKEDKDAFEAILEGVPFGLIGCVGGNRLVIYSLEGKEIVNLDISELLRVWRKPFVEFRASIV